MKLIYLHQYFKKPSMNGGVRSYEFAKRLVDAGHNVTVITSDAENTFTGWKVETVDGINVHWISVKYSNHFGFARRLFAFFKFIILATFHIIRLESDKLIATSTPLTVAIPALLYKATKGKPYIFEVRDVWPEVPIALGVIRNKLIIYFATLLEGWAYKYAQTVIALSPDMKKSITKRFNIEHVSVISNAADTHLFPEIDQSSFVEIDPELKEIRSKHKKVAFYTGTFGLVNNLASFIKLSSFSTGEVGFVIVGDGREKEQLVALASEQGVLNKTLYILPSIRKNELFVLHKLFDIATSTVLPIPALYANSANKVFDAFASGSPLLINHGGWIADLIAREECGLVINNDPTAKDYEELTNFLFDSSRLKRARENSLRLGRTTFNREILFSDFLAIIER